MLALEDLQFESQIEKQHKLDGDVSPKLYKLLSKALLATAKESPEAAFDSGLAFAYEIGLPKNIENQTNAVGCFSIAVQSGHIAAHINLGSLYFHGRGVEQNFDEALRLYRKAAMQNHPIAQRFLGNMYTAGCGVEQNDKIAVQWYRKAAEQDDPSGQNALGVMYAAGRGVDQSDEVAVQWYRKAAEQNYPAAQRNLAVKYFLGHVVDQSEEMAEKWYRKAAEQGDAQAQFFLGGLYFKGSVVGQSDEKAVQWWRRSAAQGEPLGQRALGLSYANGLGVERDDEMAEKWYRKAAEQGDKEALKWCQENGILVDKTSNNVVSLFSYSKEDETERARVAKAQEQFEKASPQQIIGEKLKAARLKSGMSQNQVGKAMGSDHTAVRRIEKGETNARIETIYRFAQAVGLKTLDF